MAAFFTKNIVHICGHPAPNEQDHNLRLDQFKNQSLLRKTGKLRLSTSCDSQELEVLLRNASTGDVFIFDGHGTFEGEIVLKNGLGLSGTNLKAMMRDTNSKCVFYLNCCYAARIVAHVDGAVSDTDLRNIIAKLLSYKRVSPLHVKGEVNHFMKLINDREEGRQNIDDDEHDDEKLANRFALAIKQIGMEQFPLIFPHKIAPLAVRKMLVINDPILKALGYTGYCYGLCWFCCC